MKAQRRSFETATLIACAGLIGAAAMQPASAGEDRVSPIEKRVDRAQRPGGKVSVTRLRVPVNKSDIVRLNYTFQDVLVGSAEIAEIVPLSNREIYVLGKKLGTTNISVFDHEKRLLSLIDVEVGLDTSDIAAKVRAGIGSHMIRVASQGEKVVLSGTAPDAPTVDRAVTIATALAPTSGGVINTIRIASPQQVLLKVRLIEVNRSATREFGFRLEYAGHRSGVRVGHVGSPNAPLTTTGGSGLGLLTDVVPAVAPATLQRTLTPPFGQILGRFIGDSQKLDVIISALEEKGLARRLAEPNLVALSGDSADFLAGGEFPVPVASTSQAGVPTITVQFKEFGVRLGFTPTVLADGAINLRLEPEVSEIDPSVSVSTGVVSVPGLSKRRAKTTVELRDGQSFAIAGLLQAITHREIEQFPWLGSVPVIGALFRSAAFRQRDTELVMIVTPHLVNPAGPGALIETPLDTMVPSNDVDLFLMGKLELKRDRPAAVQHYVTTNEVIAGRHGHILPAPAPIAAPPPVAPAAVAVPGTALRTKN